MTGATATSNPRRSQAARTAETRTRLLDAAVQVLAEEGYVGATTRRICEAAGVSQGAMTYHFPQRSDLVASAVEHAAERRLERYRDRSATAPAGSAERLRDLLDLMWEDLSSEAFTVCVKVFVAATDEPELYDRLVPVARGLRRSIQEVALEIVAADHGAGAKSLLDDLTIDADSLDQLVPFLVNWMAGLALTSRFEPRDKPLRTAWPNQRQLLEQLLLGN